MKITFKGFPWPHIIEDNFLKQTDFRELLDISTTLPTGHDNQVIVASSIISIDGRIEKIAEGISEALLKSIHRNCNEKLVEHLKALAPQKVELYDYSIISILRTGKNYSYRIHDDVAEKLLSVVVYIDPEDNRGTLCYKSPSKKSFVYEVPWKQNRALVFSRLGRRTWHSYCGDKENQRITLVYNLMTRHPIKAIKSEVRYPLSLVCLPDTTYIAYLRDLPFRIRGYLKKIILAAIK